MKNGHIAALLVSLGLVLPSGPSAAAEAKPPHPLEPPKAAAKDKQARPKGKPVDINSASKAELKKLRDIDDALAEKIIAGRPYLSKAHLVTRNVLPQGLYEQIKGNIVARQKPEYLKNAQKK